MSYRVHAMLSEHWLGLAVKPKVTGDTLLLGIVCSATRETMVDAEVGAPDWKVRGLWNKHALFGDERRWARSLDLLRSFCFILYLIPFSSGV